MKRFLFGGSCLGMLELCIVSGFILILVGSVVFTQSQVGSGPRNSAPTQLSKPAPSATLSSPNTAPSSSDAKIDVTIESVTQPATTPQPSSPGSTSSNSSPDVNPTA